MDNKKMYRIAQHEVYHVVKGMLMATAKNLKNGNGKNGKNRESFLEKFKNHKKILEVAGVFVLCVVIKIHETVKSVDKIRLF